MAGVARFNMYMQRKVARFWLQTRLDQQHVDESQADDEPPYHDLQTGAHPRAAKRDGGIGRG